MRQYVSNFVRTLSRQRQERVSTLLEEARVGKEQLDAIAARLGEQEGFAPISLARDEYERFIRAYVTSDNVGTIARRLFDLYEVSNLVSVLLSSHAAVLATDVKAIEDELIALEKMANNYAFLLADNQTYNYAHLEPFSDERGRDVDLTNIPDRAGIAFGPSEMAAIRTDEGTLTLPESTTSSYGLVGELIKGNASEFVISDTGLDNALVTGSSTGWKLTIAAAGAVSTRLPEAPENSAGAQVLLEFRMSQAAPASEIKLIPYADMPMDVLHIKTFTSDEDNVGTEILSEPYRLEYTHSFFFTMRPVARFQVLLSQPTYERVTRVEKVEEANYARIIDNRPKRQGFRPAWMQRTSAFYQNIVDRLMGAQAAWRARTPGYGSYPVSTVDDPIIRIQPIEEDTILDAVVRAFPVLREYVNQTVMRKTIIDRTTPTPAYVQPPPNERVVETGYNYYYTLGLHYVGIGANAPGFKGAFVSKALPASGDAGEVRIKTGETNHVLAMTERHSPVLTSVEYSVSNVTNPVRESDWVPILPINTADVVAERIFVDSVSGVGHLRFPAIPSASVILYKNGYRFDIDPQDYLTDLTNAIIGVRVPVGLFVNEDVFTVDYTPVGDRTTVNFEALGFANVPLVSAHDSSGAGERYVSTGERNTLDLDHTPYVDPDVIADGGTPYMIVQLQDGTVAENLTEYRANMQNPQLPSADEGYYYIHSGGTLRFNQPITQPFRVYYQYLQNNVRVRVVLRSNSTDFVSPAVDYFHIKAKTRQPDTRRVV